ncbi:MAG: serine hydrolase domain-containing protein [Actinomycetota bacterium]
MSGRRRLPAITIVVTLAALAVPRLSPAAAGCGGPGATWFKTTAENVGMDTRKLAAAMDWATQHASYSTLVIRHGCIAGWSRLDRTTSEVAFDGWSMTKSVTAMIVGRAVTMGLFDIDRPLSTWIPEADAAHGRITPRDLLTMSSGLHHNWFRDPPFAGEVMPDQVRDALSLPIDAKPGTAWAYQQTPVTLLLNLVERAVKTDVQDWAQGNLFGPIGIEAGTWTWERDRAGNTEGWAHLHMRPADWARLGYLMLHEGNWNGKQLISRAYHAKATTPIALNGAYGYLFWLNDGGEAVWPDVYGRDTGPGGPWPGAPADTYGMVGMQNQRVWVIPSLDMVIVRMGQPGEADLDTRNSVWQSQPGVIDHEIPRQVVQAITDVRFPDPGPYQMGAPTVPPLDEGLARDARRTDDVLAGIGVPGYAPEGCTPLGCS